MNKTDEILNHIINIKENVGKIEGHLKALNGRVDRNIGDISHNKKEIGKLNGIINKVKNKLAYFMGGAAILIVVLELIFKYIL